MNKKTAIIMVGAPGSGKGTQGEILEKNTNFKRYVMSDLIKKNLKPETKLYDKVFRQGVLLGDSDVFKIFREQFNSEKNIIIDGIPRTLDQAYWLYGYLKRHNYSIQLIYLQIDETQLLKRITARRYCPKCHASYNLLTNPPKKKGMCDTDGEELIQREDDTQEVFSQRLRDFDEVKNVILEVYEAEEIVINADRDIEEISSDIKNSI